MCLISRSTSPELRSSKKGANTHILDNFFPFLHLTLILKFLIKFVTFADIKGHPTLKLSHIFIV